MNLMNYKKILRSRTMRECITEIYRDWYKKSSIFIHADKRSGKINNWGRNGYDTFIVQTLLQGQTGFNRMNSSFGVGQEGNVLNFISKNTLQKYGIEPYDELHFFLRKTNKGRLLRILIKICDFLVLIIITKVIVWTNHERDLYKDHEWSLI